MKKTRASSNAVYSTIYILASIFLVFIIVGISVYHITEEQKTTAEVHKQLDALRHSYEKLNARLKTTTEKHAIESEFHKQRAFTAIEKLKAAESRIEELNVQLAQSQQMNSDRLNIDSIEVPNEMPADEVTVENQGAARVVNTENYRVWHDKKGERSYTAKLVDCDEEQAIAHLLTENNEKLSVAFGSLSIADVEYCLSVSRQAGMIKSDDAGQDELLGEHENINENNLSRIDGSLNNLVKKAMATSASQDTTLVKQDQYQSSVREFISSIKGLKLQVHFLVSDVSIVENLGRDRVKINLSLTAPDIPLSISAQGSNTQQQFTVIVSSQLAQNIKKGDVVRVVGMINETSRKSFAYLNFFLATPTLSWNVIDLLKNAASREFGYPALGRESSIVIQLYIEQMRRLNDLEREAYMALQNAKQVSE